MNVLIKDLPPGVADYFDTCARIRDITVTSLFERLVMTIAQDQLVLSILDDDSTSERRKGEHRYRPLKKGNECP